MSAPGRGTSSLASSEQRPCCACPEARHAPETGIQAGGGAPRLASRLSDAAFVPPGSRGTSAGRSGSIRLGFARGPRVPERPPSWNPAAPASSPRPAPGHPELPLGSRQSAAQPARQHLRLSAHSPSELHSCVQFSSSFSSGHTPVFSAAVPGRGREDGQGETGAGPRECPPPAPGTPNLKLQGMLSLWP